MAEEKNANERLAEQQAAFNKEALKSQEIIDSLSETFGEDLFRSINASAAKIRGLNTELGQGVDITKKLNKEILDSGKRIEELEFQRQLNLASLSKEEAIRANRLVDAQLKGENSLRAQLELLNQHLEKEEAITKEEEKQAGLLNRLKKGFEDNFNITGDQLKKMFTLAGVLDMMVKGLKNANENSVWISKNLGYGAFNATKMTYSMQAMSLASDETNVTLSSLRAAVVDLATATGGVAEFSEDALKTQVMLTKQMGLTGEEAAKVYETSLLTGKASSQINDEMLEAFASTRNAVRGSANFQKTMAAALKVSGQLSANFRNDPALITKAVVKMQALGTTIEKTKQQGDKLLDFESSIESELKAELLTGKQLNLERARAAALAGDQVTLAEELAKNVGTLDDFQNMNVLQQKALAEAMGLTTDELADQLRKQKMAQEQGKTLEQINKEEFEAAQKRKTIQEKFNNMMEKLMDIVGSIGTLFEPLIAAITFFADHSWIIYTALGIMLLSKLPAIAAGFGGIVGQVRNLAGGLKNAFSMEGIKGWFSKVKEGFKGGLFGKKGGGNLTETATSTAGKASEAAGGAEGAAGKGGGFFDKFKGIKTTDMIKGAAAILILSAALFVAAKAFQEFATVKWEDVGKGVVGIGALAGIAFLLGKAQGDMIKGALSVAILGVALIPFAYAMSLIAGLDIGAVLAAAAGLVIFGAAAAGLGFILPFILAGAIGIAALGLSLIAFGAGLKLVSEGGKGITELFKQLTELDVEKLNTIAPALGTIGDAILNLGAGTVLTAIGGLIGGEGPVGIIRKISESGAGLQMAATGLQGVAAALMQVSIALASIDTDKLEALSDFSAGMSVGSAVKGITDLITAPIKAIGNIAGGGGAENQGNAEMVKAINEVRDAVSKLYNKELPIYLDGTKVGTTLTQGSYKVA